MLLPVPSASPSMIKSHVFSSSSKYPAREKADRIPKRNDSNVVMLIAYFPANFLYAGFATFTMLVITVEHTIKVKIKFVIFIYN